MERYILNLKNFPRMGELIAEKMALEIIYGQSVDLYPELFTCEKVFVTTDGPHPQFHGVNTPEEEMVLRLSSTEISEMVFSS